MTPHGKGQVEVVCGCMFSGKTEELIRRLRRADIAKQKIQVFKPAIDDRYATHAVVSHARAEYPAVPVTSSEAVLAQVGEDTQVVGLDEVQFFDLKIAFVAETLANRGVRVICAGLDLDAFGEPFGPMPALIATAEHVTKLAAVCTVCGEPAYRSFRKSGTTDQVEVGADQYEARCREHFKG